MAPSLASEHTTISDFDPEYDALVSTREFENGHHAIHAKDGAMNYHDDMDQDLDYAINTSALQKAFPEFSEASSSDDEEDDISIEVGRGGRRSYQRADDSIMSTISIEDSRHSASPANKNDGRRELGPRPALRNVSNRGAKSKDSLRKDAQIRRASLVAQKENIDPRPVKSRSGATGTRDRMGSQRRTLSDIHARVAETYDGSYVSDERPTSVNLTTRNTRFGQVSGIAQAVNKASGRAYLNNDNRDSRIVNGRRHPTNGTVTTELADNTNHESFALPDVHNLSELVSDIYEDIPQPNQRPVRRTTRFASPPAVTVVESEPNGHLVFNEIPIPEDEKAIFNSLRLLQSKVETLEKENDEAEVRIHALEHENVGLKSESVRRQNDEGLKARIDRAQEDGLDRGAARLAVEKNRLEAVNLTLQNRLSLAHQKVTSHEDAMNQAMQERNSVMNQLGVCMNCQDLKTENHTLRYENDELQAELERLTTRHDTYTEQSVQEPRHAAHSRREKREAVSKSRDQSSTNQQRKNDDQYNELFSIDMSSLNLQKHADKNAQKSAVRSKRNPENKRPNTSKQRVRKVTLDGVDDSDGLDVTNTNGRNFTTQTGASEDLTFLSFIDRNDIALLRKSLEEERIARKQQRTKGVTEHRGGKDTAQSRTETHPADPSALSLHGHPSQKSKQTSKDPVKHKTPSAEQQRNVTSKDLPDPSNAGQAKLNRKRSMDDHRTQTGLGPEMTSAFILPDITIHNENSNKFSVEAQRVVDDMVRHEKNHCSVCKKIVDGQCEHDKPNKIPKPGPVSERIQETHNEDHTLRPSQPPSFALATVLKGLEDELAHLRMQLTMCQSSYNKHDASLGKRQRRSAYQKVQLLMRAVEEKSDQIYALYDVLEAQKQNGAGVTEQDVEVTLNTLGIGAKNGAQFDLAERLGVDEPENQNRGKGDALPSDSEDEQELPWEGIESTNEFTERSLPLTKTVRRV